MLLQSQPVILSGVAGSHRLLPRSVLRPCSINCIIDNQLKWRYFSAFDPSDITCGLESWSAPETEALLIEDVPLPSQKLAALRGAILESFNEITLPRALFIQCSTRRGTVIFLLNKIDLYHGKVLKLSELIETALIRL